jgi:hypothetical protein
MNVPKPINASEYSPDDFIHNVTPEAIGFFVHDLAGLYLPDDFVSMNPDGIGVSSWNIDNRLLGSFARYQVEDHDDVLLMGTTIGLPNADNSDLDKLRHYEFSYALVGLNPDTMSRSAKAVDYGRTLIKISQDGTTEVRVSGCSADYGRANPEVRQSTCKLFSARLPGIQVVNVDPVPKEYDKIIRN